MIKKTGKELTKELIETVSWNEGKFVAKSSSESKTEQNYKIIVACAVGEVSEDSNYFYDDIEQFYDMSDETIKKAKAYFTIE